MLIIMESSMSVQETNRQTNTVYTVLFVKSKNIIKERPYEEKRSFYKSVKITFFLRF